MAKNYFAAIDDTFRHIYAPTELNPSEEAKQELNGLSRNRFNFYCLLITFLFHTFSFFTIPSYPRDLYLLTSLFLACSIVGFMTIGRNNRAFFDFSLKALIVIYLPFLTMISDNFLFLSIAGTWIIPSVTFLSKKHYFWSSAFSFLFLLLLYTFYLDVLSSKILTSNGSELVSYFKYQLKLIMLAGFLNSIYLIGTNRDSTLKSSKIQEIEQKFEEKLKAAENKLKTQETFTFSLSHELRNPLNSLLGNLEIAKKEAAGSVIKTLHTAQICGDILLQMVNNILDSAKAEMGNLEVTYVETDIFEVLEKVWTACAQMIKKKGLQGRLFVSKKMPRYLMIDPHRITQTLMNLLSNSSKFTDRGIVVMRVEWCNDQEVSENTFRPTPYTEMPDPIAFNEGESIDEMATNKSQDYFTLNLECTYFDIPQLREEPISRGGVLKVSISDSGCGINNKQLDLLFQKFGQLNADPNKRKMGTGLGLWITKQLCEKMNGQIRPFSKVGLGTTFVVCLKCETPSKVSLRNLSRIQTIEAISSIKKDPRSKIIGMVIEDNQYDDVTTSLLESQDVNVLKRVNNIEGALGEYFKLEQKIVPLDLITIDLDTIGLDGKVAFTKIRDFEIEKGLSHTMILMIGSEAKQGDIKQYLGSEQTYFRKKPLSYSDLNKIILEISLNKYEKQNEIIKNTISNLESRLEIDVPTKKKILVADDDTFNLTVIEKFLKKENYEVLEATNGRDAVELYKRKYYEIGAILLDFEMNIMTGYEASKVIREEIKKNNRKDILIFGVTGHDRARVVELARSHGMDDVFTKPLDYKRLFNILKESMDQRFLCKFSF